MKRKRHDGGEERPEELEQDGGGAQSGEAAGESRDAGAAALAEAEQQVADLRERYARALADQENARKRHLREMEGARQYAIERFARDLLQVVDNLERALAAAPPERAGDPVLGGVRLVDELLRHVLEQHGVKAVPAVGQPFDPNFHEVVAAEPRDDVAQNTVIDELVRGYRIGDRLLRAAMVRVAAPPAGGG